jgi:hypothetical protein
MKRSDLIDAIYCAKGAIEKVLENWETGDLAGAVNELRLVKEQELDPAIAWWESDE